MKKLKVYNELTEQWELAGEENQPAFKKIKIGNSELEAKSTQDRFQIEAGDNVQISANADTRTIEISTDLEMPEFIHEPTTPDNSIGEEGDIWFYFKDDGYGPSPGIELNDAIPIACWEDLQAIGSASSYTFASGTEYETTTEGGLDKNYVQVANINMENKDNWTPIGWINETTGLPFTGHYNGNFRFIKSMTINHPGQFDMALFYENTGMISNTMLLNVNVQGLNNAASLAVLNSGLVENCVAVGQVTLTGNIGSGLVAVNELGGSIVNSAFKGNVTGNQTTAGFVADNKGTVEDCYFAGTVTGGDYLAGFVADSEDGSVIHCYSQAAVTSTTGQLVGAFIQNSTNAVVNNSYYDSNLTVHPDTSGAWPKTSTELKQQSTFSNWNFENIWEILTDSMPNLQIENQFEQEIIHE